MPLLSLFCVLAAPTKQEISHDAAFLQKVHRAIHLLTDKKAAIIRFEQTIRPADALTCKRLLPSLAKNSEAYAETSFVQAWYGVDYETNLNRVLRPYILWSTHINRWDSQYGQANDDFSLLDLSGVANGLNLLYLKRHDLIDKSEQSGTFACLNSGSIRATFKCFVYYITW